MAGPDALVSGRFRAHDTRSVSSSWALFNGASLKDIQQAAYWSSPNTFISCYPIRTLCRKLIKKILEV